MNIEHKNGWTTISLALPPYRDVYVYRDETINGVLYLVTEWWRVPRERVVLLGPEEGRELLSRHMIRADQCFG